MCIAIAQMPEGDSISKEVLAICAENNPDGCGFSYINTDHFGVSRLKIWKGMDFSSFHHQYERARRINPSSPFLIHFRIKTHGTVDKFNCHPFKIDEEKVFIHNGIISGMPYDVRKSDTQLFNEEVLQGLPDDWFYNDAVKKLIEDFIGFSKLAVLTINGEVEIYNEDKGEWLAGNWYSNDSYKAKPVKAFKTSNRWDRDPYWTNRKPYVAPEKDGNTTITSPPANITGKALSTSESIALLQQQIIDQATHPTFPLNGDDEDDVDFVDIHAEEHGDDNLQGFDECDYCGLFDGGSLMLSYLVDGAELKLCNACSCTLRDEGIITSADLIIEDWEMADNYDNHMTM